MSKGHRSHDSLSKHLETEKATAKQAKPKRTPHRTLLTLFDYRRMGQLQQILARIAQAKSMAQALRPVLEEVTQVVNSSACQFFTFTKNAFTAADRRELTI